jgi:hypothetical protein
MNFFTIVLGNLWGVAINLATNVVASEIFERVSQQDVNSLIEECLQDAIREKANLLNRYTSTLFTGEGRPKTHLNTRRLRELIEEDALVNPVAMKNNVADPWRPFLLSFKEIIVIPGCSLNDDDYIDLIKLVLLHASNEFNRRVPYRHPAFEQILLEYQRKHDVQLQNIQASLETVPERTARFIKQSELEAMESKEREALTKDWTNPFSVVAADDLDLANPEHIRKIRDLFISRYTDLPTIKKRFHTILEGQRGTGKTMIMKYLAFETQILEWIEKYDQLHSEFFKAPDNFIGVYSKLEQGVFDKSDFDAIKNEARRERVFEHRLVLKLMYDVLQTMKSVFMYVSPPPDQLRRIKRSLGSILKTNGILDQCSNWCELVQAVQDIIDDVMVPEVDEHLASVAPGGSPTTLNPRLTMAGQFVPFLNKLRQACNTTIPFYLMLDDFDVLEGYQQTATFKVASARQFNMLCFKFGVMVLGRKAILSGPGRTFRPGDDYDPIDLDWTAGGLHEKYQEAVNDIAQARLKQVQWPDLQSLLLEWKRGNEIKQEVERELQKEWDEVEPKPTQKKADYISNYGNARFFQKLRQRKIRMRYAGLDYVTMASSGIMRQFLETCKLIFDRAHDQGWIPEKGGISPEIQNDAIRESSEQMVKQLTHTSGDLQSLLSGNIQVTSLQMLTFIESLCDVFYSRLHTPNFGDPEDISIAVRDDLTALPEAKALLDVALRESILHKYLTGYGPKTAGGPPLPTYMLNRRLGPRRDLSIRRMQGRIEIEGKSILLAAKDRVEFFQSFNRKKTEERERQIPLQYPSEGTDPNGR